MLTKFSNIEKCLRSDRQNDREIAVRYILRFLQMEKIQEKIDRDR